MALVTFSNLLCVFSPRKVTKESLVETSSNITESLMSISRMMAEQVKQSEDAIGLLGKENKSDFALCGLTCVSSSFALKTEQGNSCVSFSLCVSLPITLSATSSRTVQETNEEFKNMTGTIHLGRKLILKYNRRELTDKLFIFLALALFFATVLYILKKRLFPFI